MRAKVLRNGCKDNAITMEFKQMGVVVGVPYYIRACDEHLGHNAPIWHQSVDCRGFMVKTGYTLDAVGG